MKKTMNKAFIIAAAVVIMLSGCARTGEKSEKYFSNTFKGNYFEIDYPDGLTPTFTQDGANFSGEFSVIITGYRQQGTKDGQMPENTDKLSELGITLGNFETDKINGHTAYIIDSENVIIAIFPLDGCVAVVMMTNGRSSQSFGMNAEKMLKSFKITDQKLIPGAKDLVPNKTNETESKTDIIKEEKPENSDNTEVKPPKKWKPVAVDTSGKVAGTFFDSEYFFIELRPGFLVNTSTKTSVNINGRVGDMSKLQQINIFITPPIGVSAAEYAYKYAGGKKPTAVNLGTNTFQSIVNNVSNGGKITMLFYCTDYYTCKVVIIGTMQLTGEVKEIVSSIIFK